MTHNTKVILEEKIVTKKIKCYWCKETTGEAILVRKLMSVGKGSEGKVRTKEWLDIWDATGFRQLYNDRWICHSCSNKKCLKCHILLSNKIKCRCGIKHGAFYSEHSLYCKECWDIISKEKNDKSK